MFSGKTEELIRRLKRATFARQETMIFKPSLDNRYHPSHVVSHDEKSIPSVPVRNSKEILEKASRAQVVGIDECQFFDDNLPDVCNQLANDGVRVVVAGLDMDYRGKPFGPMPHLLAIAEFVTKLHAICVRTGKLANFSYRTGEEDAQLQLGGTDSYLPLSRSAYLKATQNQGKQDEPEDENP